MNEIMIFENPDFGQVRTIEIDGEPWFVGKDVAIALGYEKPTDTVRKRVDEEDRGVSKMETPSGIQKMTIINESGLYSLILGSKLQSARKFKHWVTSEVLPAIRKTGTYSAKPLSGKELLAAAVIEAQRTIEEKNAEIERMRPKEIFADAVSGSKESILIRDMAKLICQNGYQIGERRLFQWMRDNGYLIKSGSSRNRPTQRYLQQGIFEISERAITSPEGNIRLVLTPRVTGKGQRYFIDKFLNVGGIK